MRVVDRVHGHAAGLRAFAQPAVAAGLADVDDFMIRVADLADGGAALLQDQPHFAGGQLDLGVLAFLGDDHAHTVPALRAIWPPLPILSSTLCTKVPSGIERIVRAFPGLISRLIAGDNQVADLEADRGKDIALLAVHIVQQGNARRTVRVVLDGRHLGRDLLLVTLEVDQAIALLVAAARVPAGDPAGIVAAAGFLGGASSDFSGV